MKTHLNIDIVSNYDCKILSILDTSYYNNQLPILDPLLIITPPGFKNGYSFSYVPNQKNSFSAYDLGLVNATNNETLPNLPDGVYKITQQICPHDQLYNTYYHMRVCNLLNLYYTQFCKIINFCNYENKEIKYLIEKLNKIKFFIDASKYSSDYCLDIEKAMCFYYKAEELLIDFDKCKNC